MANLTGRQLAVELGVSHTAINKAFSVGRITREADGGFDLEKCRNVWNENVNIHQQARGAPERPEAPAQPVRPDVDDNGNDESRFSTAKIQRLAELEKLARLRRDNAREIGELLPRAEVLSMFALVGRIYSQSRESLPESLAPQLIGKDLDEIERIVDAVLAGSDRDVCKQIESRLAAFAGVHDDSHDESRVAA